MIANILITILLAIGIATGNVSSNIYKGGNAFNNEIEKQPLNEKRTSEVTYEDYYHPRYVTKVEYNNYFYTEKWYLQDTPTGELSPTSIFENCIMYNSVYGFCIDRTGQFPNRLLEVYYIIKFQNLYTSQNTIEFEAGLTADTANNNYGSWGYNIYQTTNTNTERLIDMTITQGTLQTLRDIWNPIRTSDETTLEEHYQTDIGTDDLPVYIECTTPRIVLENNETTYLVIHMFYTFNVYSVATDTSIQILSGAITGKYLQQEINYEIVDIPNLMYTILTMPFSFISQAFNLTLFPGTAYAVNISNIFMVLIAALILLWIIKKVI